MATIILLFIGASDVYFVVRPNGSTVQETVTLLENFLKTISRDHCILPDLQLLLYTAIIILKYSDQKTLPRFITCFAISE